VVTFSRHLQFLDSTEPFGESFGPAATRTECIESAHAAFQKLLAFAPHDSTGIPFDVLSIITLDDDGMEDNEKKNALRKVFRPDVHDELPLIAFIQSIDVCYKRLRFFRASVENCGVIDNVLEQIVNGFF
jgi:hypothetical protein